MRVILVSIPCFHCNVYWLDSSSKTFSNVMVFGSISECSAVS